MAKYLALSKARLSFLIVYTTVNGFLMAPVALHLPTFLLTCVGTTLTVASANSINQYIEVDHDILMRRTANRPLPTGELSLTHALLFGISTGIAGTTILALGVNELAAGLALGNILLYTLVYTPLKRVHWSNTWVGAIVGAIPPMIGWAGATGDLSSGALVLAYTLLIWQIPHFLALSWSLKADYERAGYKMLVSSDPEKARRLAYRYCYYFLPIPLLALLTDLTTMPFAVEAVLLNIWLIYQGHQFYKEKTGTTARRLFLSTLWYLAILLICFIIHKKAGYSIEHSQNNLSNKEEEDTQTPKTNKEA
uniref:Protoheme IX farnesyltransferase, mitochondrial n=2 Tax=Arcella intermedia TaxID=1963864 RepID=A0A6B2LB11_9EUKA